MNIRDNPYQSLTFQKIWMRHFQPTQKPREFSFLKGLKFYKSKLFPLFISAGKNLTKGNVYELNKEIGEHDNKVFLIYDVHAHFNRSSSPVPKNIQVDSVSQYPGFLMDFKGYANLKEYMAQLSKNSRYKFNKYYKRLEHSFEISSKMLSGHISKEEYDFVFDKFHALLVKRFTEKQITNNNLNPSEWEFYREVAYSMILEGKASLFVIYSGKEPIAITLCYFADKVIFDTIRVFDIAYFKFNLGTVSLMKIIEWGISNNFEKIDFSKGDFEYKRRWANQVYHFDYHILHNKNSLKAKLLARTIKSFFALKLFLREKKINEWLHRTTYRLLNKENKKTPPLTYSFSELTKEDRNSESSQINIEKLDSNVLKQAIYDFLYLYKEIFNELVVYQIVANPKVYTLRGKSKSLKLEILESKTRS